MYNNRIMYFSRGLESSIVAALSASPVVILEGPRSVGKTTLVNHLRSERHLASTATLADSTTRLAAETDPVGWLQSLPRPTAIDEAQLVAAIPLAIKGIIDREGGNGHFLLTGSAVIGRTGLGGTDPLTSRTIRKSLEPMAASELRSFDGASQGSLIDLLFDESINTQAAWPQPSREDLCQILLLGGFPGNAIHQFIGGANATRAHRERVRSTVISTLSDAVVDDEKLDEGFARRVLDALVGTPGCIFNASKLGESLSVDRRTIDRYWGILERRFLLRSLPNLAFEHRAPTKAHHKIHPVDSSIAEESLDRAGSPIGSNPEQFGQLLESYVVQQFHAHAGWANLATNLFFWRDSKTQNEVDLVLVDSRNRRIAIEIKASSSIRSRDLRGFKALQERGGLHRGFFFYTGESIQQVDVNTWAIPISALRELSRIRDPSPKNATPKKKTMRPMSNAVDSHSLAASEFADAALFLSYARSDDEYYGGAITHLAEDLVNAYQIHYGRTLQLFVDRKTLEWGSVWEKRLTTELESTTFFLAIITPSYLKSTACRKEFTQFDTRARKAGDPALLLPILWIEPPKPSKEFISDPVLKSVLEHQYKPGHQIRDLRRESLEYRHEVEELAASLYTIVNRREQDEQEQQSSTAPDSISAQKSVVTLPDKDILELLEEFEKHEPKLASAIAEFGFAFGEIGSAFQSIPVPAHSSPTALQSLFRQVTMKTREPEERLRGTSESINLEWKEIDRIVSQIVDLARRLGGLSIAQDLKEQLGALVNQTFLHDMEAVEQQIVAMGHVSRQLRPLSRTLTAALDSLRQIQLSARTWRDAL